MPNFEAGDVVRVPFPYIERPVRQFRPALVVSADRVGKERDLLWVLMITSAENRGWPGDVEVGGDHEKAGLPVPSVVRTAKIATIDARAAETIGRVEESVLESVREHLRSTLAL